MGHSFTFEPESEQMEMGYNDLLPRYTGPPSYPDGKDGLVSSPAMDEGGGGSVGFEWDADSQLYYHARSASLIPNRFVSRDMFRRLGDADGRRPVECGISCEVRF
jgi:hypothetical protein